MNRAYRGVAAGVILALLSAGCSAGTEQATAVDGGQSAPEATTDPQVQRLVYGVRQPSQVSNDVNRDVHANEEFQLKPMYENLIGVDPETGGWVPMLAESWQLTDAGDLEMDLREGVPFHGGHGEFTAADVAFTYEHLIEPEGALTGVAQSLRDSVEGLEIVDDHRIIWRLAEPSLAFLEGISYGATGMAILSKADFDSRGGVMPTLEDEPLAGTGPYRFMERTPEHVVFAAVDDHWRQTPDFPELEYRFMSEASTIHSALLAEEIHVAELPEDLTQDAGERGMEVIEAQIPGRRVHLNFVGAYLDPPGVGISDPAVCGNRNEDPLWDRGVRRAISKAIDREALNTAFFGGRAEHMAMSYWQPELSGWNPEWEERWDEVYGYDPQASEELLEAAGYEPNELTINVLAIPDSGGPEASDVMEAVAAMLGEVGIDTEIVTADASQHYEKLFAHGYEQALEFDSTSSEVVTGFHTQGYSPAGVGRAVESCEIDRIYRDEVLTKMTPEAYDEAYREVGNVVFDMVQHVPLFRIRSQRVVNPEVVGDYEVPGAGMSAPYSFVEYISAAE